MPQAQAQLEGTAERLYGGVRINSVHPSPVNTQMMRRLEESFAPGHAEEARTGIGTGIPVGRYVEAEYIADAVLYLASEASRFVTGGVQLRVDGGQLSRSRARTPYAPRHQGGAGHTAD